MILDIKIEIPESINDIKLWHWQKYMSIVKEDADVEFANRKALEIFYGIDGKHKSRRLSCKLRRNKLRGYK